MSKLLNAALLSLMVAAATPASAQTPFDGTWKADLSSMKMQAKPERFSIAKGVYACATCTPPYSVKADGAFHAVKGRPYWDEIAITVVDDRHATFAFKKGGKVISTNEETVSADGNTLTMTSHNTNNGGNVPIDSSSSETRIGAPVAGAHLISGTWQPAPPTSVSDQSLTIALAISDGMLHLKSGLGETLDARIGGGYTLNVGDPGKTMTKVEQPDARTLRMTDMRAGKVTQVSTYTVGDDGVLHGVWRDPQTGDTGGFTATRQ